MQVLDLQERLIINNKYKYVQDYIDWNEFEDLYLLSMRLYGISPIQSKFACTIKERCSKKVTHE